MRILHPTRLLAFSLLLPILSGCNAPIPMHNMSSDPAQLAEVRAQLAQIPAPSKSRYMAIKSLDAWQNPYITVQANIVTIHVLVADANTSDLGVGGLLRPVGARKQDLNVRTTDLPEAVNAIPTSAWPYGRVIAIEEAHNTPASAVPEVRRNVELAVKTLTDAGVVAYEWQEGGAALR